MHKTPLARAISLAIAAASLGAAGPAIAQEEETSATPETAIEEIVVTGSRIRRDTFSAPQPMDVVAPGQAVVQGVGSISSLLQSGTTAAGSPQVTAATSTAFVQSGGVGAQTLSLRGLGANRTLVLLNGRRAGPAGTRGEVSAFDFNVLPLSVVERVEILKDGASSIYGSDAVAGVVNIITKTDEGLDIDAFYSAPQRSGGEEARFNVSWGENFERGRFRVTADYHKEEELTQGDRSWFRCAEQYMFSPETGERRDIIDPRTNRPACDDLPWGHVWLYNYQRSFTADGGLGNVPRRTGAYAQYDYDRNLGNFIPPIAVDPNQPWYLSTPPGWFIVNYDRLSEGVTNADHPFQDGESLVPEIERTTFFADGEFEVTDSLTAYGEVLLNRRKTKANGYRQFWTYLYAENFDFANFEVGVGGDPRSAGWRGAMFFSPLAITDHADDEITVDYQRFVGGLRGSIGDRWNWEFSAQYSESDGDYESDQIFNDAIEEWNYAYWSGSCVGEVTSVRGVPCVDVPWFDPQFLAGEITGDVRDFLFGREKGNTKYTQWTAEAYVTGPIFDLPAGPVSIAAGVQYQEDEIRDVPGEITRSGNVWGSTTAGITEGDDNTQAVFAEVEIPLLAGKPYAQALTLTASGRYTEVDSYGSGDTYKVGINWQITDSWRIRASQGTSFRAPALFELYLADQTSFLGQRGIDPCINWGDALEAGEISDRVAANCQADGLAPDFPGGSSSATIITGGGLGVLEAETSESQTVGIVWTPRFAELSVSLDYFNIEVEDEVGQLSAGQIIGSCYDSEFFPNDPLCDLFERDALTQGIDTVRDSFLNINSQKNEGLDLTAVWRTPVGDMGVLTLETQHTYQLTQERALFEGTVEDLNGLVGEPEWVGRLNTTFERGPWSFFWGMNFIGSSDSTRERASGNDLATYRGEQVRIVVKTDEVIYHNMSLTREFDKGLKAIVGVSNVLDEEPPRLTTFNTGAGVNTVGNSAFYSQYDWYGRRFFVNVTKSF